MVPHTIATSPGWPPFSKLPAPVQLFLAPCKCHIGKALAAVCRLRLDAVQLQHQQYCRGPLHGKAVDAMLTTPQGHVHEGGLERRAAPRSSQKGSK